MSRSSPRWLGLAAALALLPGRGAGADPPGAGAAELRAEAGALVLRDDAASLQRARDLLGEAERATPAAYQAGADRALVELLVAAARRDESTRLQPGDELMRSGRELRERALEELRPLVRDHPGDPAVARALAVYDGLDGDRAGAAVQAGRARAGGGPDPWADFAELAARVRAEAPAAAAPDLAAFVASHPRLLRARMMLAVAQVGLSREDALATLDELLAVNPDHDGARRLKATLLAPPPARLVVLPAPDEAPPPQAPGRLPRKHAGAR